MNRILIFLTCFLLQVDTGSSFYLKCKEGFPRGFSITNNTEKLTLCLFCNSGESPSDDCKNLSKETAKFYAGKKWPAKEKKFLICSPEMHITSSVDICQIFNNDFCFTRDNVPDNYEQVQILQAADNRAKNCKPIDTLGRKIILVGSIIGVFAYVFRIEIVKRKVI